MLWLDPQERRLRLCSPSHVQHVVRSYFGVKAAAKYISMMLFFQRRFWGDVCCAAGQSRGTPAQCARTNQWVKPHFLSPHSLFLKDEPDTWICPMLFRAKERGHLCSGDHRWCLSDPSHQRASQQILWEGAEHDTKCRWGSGQRLRTAGLWLESSFPCKSFPEWHNNSCFLPAYSDLDLMRCFMESLSVIYQ